MSEDAGDRAVEESIRKERRFLDPKENSIVPSFLENDGLNPKDEMVHNIERRRSREIVDDNADTFDELSSDKERDTTEGEITDTHTSE